MLNSSDQKQSALIDRYRNILAMPAGSNLDQLTARFCCIADQKHPHFIQDSPHSDAERQRATVEFNALNTAYKSMYGDMQQDLNAMGQYGVFTKDYRSITLADIDAIVPVVNQIPMSYQLLLFKRLEALTDYNPNYVPPLASLSCYQAVTFGYGKKGLFDKVVEQAIGAFGEKELQYLQKYAQGCHSLFGPRAQYAYNTIIEAQKRCRPAQPSQPTKDAGFWSKAFGLNWF